MNGFWTYCKSAWFNLRYFFPVTLLIYHLKHNLVGLLYWVFFFLIITDSIGRGFGISFLFLSPEYGGTINLWSFLFIGFSFGGLTMAFHSYSYQRLATYFPFLAMVNKPFVKFCVNNSTIPLVFSIVYLVEMWQFQREQEFASTNELLTYILGYVLGFALYIGISLLYFFPINKNIYDLGKLKDLPSVRKTRWERFSRGRNLKWRAEHQHHLYWYLGRRMKIQQCRSTKHYQPVLLQSVFEQNKISTSFFEIATIIAFVLLGLFGGGAAFDVPAAMSIVLLMTILLMVFSAILSWFKFWTYPLLLVVFLLIDALSVKYGLFGFETHAYGFTYKQRVAYNVEVLDSLSRDTVKQQADLERYHALLTNWKQHTENEKPLLVIVNTSGGGSRSAAWVFDVLRLCDSITKGQSTKHIALITGASGGMVGASYFRSLKLAGKDVNQPQYYEAISSDLLNRMSFAASTNDLFFRYQSAMHGVGNYSYDRGMAFENDLNEKTGGILNQSMSYFSVPEQKGLVPVMIFAPAIVNDGRRLLLASQSLSFMQCEESTTGLEKSYEHVDGFSLFGKAQMDRLRLTSVLRMNSTFPYVLPMTTLPTNPKIQVMDAGARDNFGAKTTIQWLQSMEDWIAKETSGVLLVQIRDTKKVILKDRTKSLSFLDKFIEPLMSNISNFPETQDFDQDQLLLAYAKHLPYRFEIATFNLRTEPTDRISLSWHLTQKERELIRKSMKRPSNQAALNRLVQLMQRHN